jgi:hypothetical protein
MAATLATAALAAPAMAQQTGSQTGSQGNAGGPEVETHLSMGDAAQASKDEPFHYMMFSGEREWTWHRERGPWSFETSLSAGAEIRGGVSQGSPFRSTQSVVGGFDEKVGYALNPQWSLYAHGGAEVQVGHGVSMDPDEPTNHVRPNVGLGVARKIGGASVQAEGFVEQWRDLTSPYQLRHYGVRTAATVPLSDHERLYGDFSLGKYQFPDHSAPGFTGSFGYERDHGRVSWGPKISFEVKDHNRQINTTLEIRF